MKKYKGLRAYTEASDIASEIIQDKDIHSGLFLVVEGPCDKKLFRKLLNGKIKLFPGDNRDNVIEILKILKESKRINFGRIIGIVDLDFNDYETQKEELLLINCFVTDYRDIEIMMIESPAFVSLVSEFVSSDSDMSFPKSTEKVKCMIYQNALKLGLLRWISHKSNDDEENRLGLNFKKLNFSKFTEKKKKKDEQKVYVDINRMIDHVLEKSKRHDLDKNHLIKLIQNKINEKPDHRFYCSGHDFIELLSFCLRRVIANCNSGEVSWEKLESYLRMSYSLQYFIQTKLYKSILDWEKQNLAYKLIGD